jgi:hypothetical protein
MPVVRASLALCFAAGAFCLTVRVGAPVGAPLRADFISLGWEFDCMKPLISSMADPRLRAAAAHLAPATVRVGGITGDWQLYTGFPGVQEAGYWPTRETNFTAAQLGQVLDFFNATGLSLMLMLNELHGRDCNTTGPGGGPDWCRGAWDTSNVAAFLTYIHDNGLLSAAGSPGLVSFELGNELVSHLDAATNVADIKALAGIIQGVWGDVPFAQRPLLFAPSTDACASAEQLEIMANVSGVPGVGGFTYHGYPGQGGTSPPLSALLANATWLRAGVMAGSDAAACIRAWGAGPRDSGLALLLTESSASWAVDLPPPAQDSFLHTFFTVAELGQYAQTGVGFVARWAFSEPSPFATLRENATARAGWTPAADYWVILAHKAALGRAALAAEGADDGAVLVYAFCGRGGGGALALTAVNTGGAPARLQLADAASGRALPQAPRLEWVFTAPGGDLAARGPSLNGGAPLDLEADGRLPAAFAPAAVAAGGADILLPPMASAVFLLEGAALPACR